MPALFTNTVEEAIHRDGRITSKSIHVIVDDSTVTLHGTVDSLDEYGIVQEAVERVPGVDRVDNHLQIEGEVNTGPCCPQI